MDYFDGPTALYPTLVTSATENEEIGAGRDVVLGGIPKLGIRRDILHIVDKSAPPVIDGEVIDRIASLFHKILNLKAVVDAIAVGCHQIGELQGRRTKIV